MNQEAARTYRVHLFLTELAWKHGLNVNILKVNDDEKILVFQPTQIGRDEGPSEELVNRFTETLRSNCPDELSSLKIEVLREKAPFLPNIEDFVRNVIYKIAIS
ncbi:hypothetical protein GW937_00265 [Candidatus Kaiserbacteria bacterium]|nr:hypothetical protein [Candidatus Kaiserbacteria bacterium]NCT01737.1 hypothetical protein [Candidatus Parcubacteria bacterium]